MAKALNKRQKKTLAAIYATPVNPNIKWRDIESLFVALGATVTQSGKGMTISLDGHDFYYHRPHGRNNSGRGLVKRVREFLETMEVAP